MSLQIKSFYFDIVIIGRWLLILTLVALLFSPPLTTLFEVSLFVIFVFSQELRGRLKLVMTQPIVISVLVFYFAILISATNNLVSWRDGFESFWGWRKILFLPLATALFDEDFWKYRLVSIFVVITTICAALSFLSLCLDLAVYKYPVGIIIRNHATQGIMFSVAAYSAGILLLLKAREIGQYEKLGALLSIVILITNVVYVTPGRSGYLALIVLTITLAIAYMFINKKLLVPMVILAFISVLLLSSPTVHQRVMQGVNEASSYNNSNAEFSSMGIRMVLWKNTINLIQERPILGYGSGGFINAYKSIIENEPAWKHEITHDPHNQFLKIAVEQGGIGLIVFLGFIFSCFWQKNSVVFYFLGVGVLLVWCGNSLFSSHFSTFSEGRFIFIWCGVMLAKERIAINRSKPITAIIG